MRSCGAAINNSRASPNKLWAPRKSRRMPIGQEAGVASNGRECSISFDRSTGSRPRGARPPSNLSAPAGRAARLDLARQLYRPAKQQQFLGQSGLAGVRVRDDRTGAPPRNFVGRDGYQAAPPGAGMIQQGLELRVRAPMSGHVSRATVYLWARSRSILAALARPGDRRSSTMQGEESRDLDQVSRHRA